MTRVKTDEADPRCCHNQHGTSWHIRESPGPRWHACIHLIVGRVYCYSDVRCWQDSHNTFFDCGWWYEERGGAREKRGGCELKEDGFEERRHRPQDHVPEKTRSERRRTEPAEPAVCGVRLIPEEPIETNRKCDAAAGPIKHAQTRKRARTHTPRCRGEGMSTACLQKCRKRVQV